jgi:hypothetical protein
MGPRTSMDNVVRRTILPLPGLEIRYLCRPARKKSLAILTALSQNQVDNVYLKQ